MFGSVERQAKSRLLLKLLVATALSLPMVPTYAAKPVEALESALPDCEFLGTVEGSSGYGKNWGWQPIAKSFALQRAEKMGATHVVWQRLVPMGAFNGYAIARSYSCHNGAT